MIRFYIFQIEILTHIARFFAQGKKNRLISLLVINNLGKSIF